MKSSIVVEYVIAVGIVSWAAIKGDGAHHYWPWPPTIIYASIAFSILSLLAALQPELAGVLGAGFMLALLVRTLSNGSFFDLSGMDPQGIKNKAFSQYAESRGREDNSGADFVRVMTF